MFLFSLTTFPNKQQEEERYESFQKEQDWYLGALAKNGQILFYGCTTIFNENRFTTYLLAPEKDSLVTKNENKWVAECYQKLLSLSRCEQEINLLGKSSDYQDSCACESPSWYMLYSDHTIHESPVVCGDCGHTVPLYRLPKIFNEEEYYTVLGWQRAYNACDNLFIEGIGERSAYQRLSKPGSDLSKLGLDICARFEKATGKPFYYYLYRYYSSHKSCCPICRENWKLEADNKLFIDYCCKKCRLVGDIVQSRR